MLDLTNGTRQLQLGEKNEGNNPSEIEKDRDATEGRGSG
jgi:hypothetical protein